MIPISLRMAAFGPYLRETVIDFTRLQEQSLFLITGATGGGKTSILDGMCFALYCRATGGRRGWTEMRCDSAPDDVPTRVDFVFRLGKETYRFCRSIRVHYVRGSGRKEFREEHACWKEQNGEWELWESGSETQVRRCAEKLTGLTPEQFSQVIVLPQGDFLRLLRASSREKSEMLRTLFAMTEWVKIQDVLRERTKTLEKQVEKVDTERDALLRQEQAETPEELMEKIEQFREQEKKLTVSLQEKQKEWMQAEQRLRLCREWMQAQQRLLSEKKNVQQRLEERQVIQEKLEQQKKAMSRVPDLRQEAAQAAKRAARLEGDLQAAGQLAEIMKKLRQTKKDQEEAQLRRGKAAQIQKEYGERLAAGQKFLLEIQTATEKLPKLQEADTYLRQGIEAYQELERVKVQLQQRKKDIQLHQAQLDEEMVKAKTLTASKNHQEVLRSANQISRLASTLQEGEPCPVCGSLHHPSPANRQAEQMEDGEFEKLVQLEEQARAAVSTQEGVLHALREELTRLEQEAQGRFEKAQSFGSREEIQKQRKACTDMLIQTRAIAEKSVAAQKRLEKLSQELEKARQEEESAQRTLEGLSAREKEQLARKEELIQKWGGNLPVPEQLEKEKTLADQTVLSRNRQADQLEKEWSVLQNQIGGAESALKEAQQRVQQAEEECSQREKSWKGEKIPTEEEASARYQEKKAEVEKLNHTAGQLSQQIGSGTQSLARLKKLEEQFSHLQKAYHQAARLYKLLSGSNPMRIPVDKYVLSIMLEEILACANRYFAQFSRERYALLRSQERAANNAYSGLDLVVLDGMTGHERSVDTLSGGEQFLASLSLALGLSEVVQNQSGCVRLEALFIDEGFGSLDQETLDTAMKALAMLHQGGRMIGIISHVSELRNRISSRIEVSRLPDGTAKAEVI